MTTKQSVRLTEGNWRLRDTEYLEKLFIAVDSWHNAILIELRQRAEDDDRADCERARDAQEDDEWNNRRDK